MKNECKISYNELDDSMILSCRADNENIRKNFIVDNFIFYLTGKGKIVGIQIRDFSEVLKENDIDNFLVSNITKAYLSTIFKQNTLVIGISFIMDNKKVNIPLRVLMNSTIQ